MRAFLEIYRYELVLNLRRPSTWIYAVLLLVVSIFSAALYDAGSGTLYTAPVTLAENTLVIAFVGVLVSAALFGDAASRDPRSGMNPLFYTLSLGRGAYLGGRFAGAFTVNALVLLLAVPLGLVLGGEMMVDRAYLGPFHPWPYLQPLLLFALPNLLVNGAVLFGLALLSRRALPGYLGALALFLGYTVAMAAASAVVSSPVAWFLDPSGIVAGGESIEAWTFAERNARLMPLAGPLLLNRITWLSLAVLMLAGTWSRFRFAHPAEGGRRGREPAGDAAPEGAAVPVPAAPRFFGAGARLRQVAAIGRASFREIALSRDFVAVMAGAVIFVVLFGREITADDRFGVPSWPLAQFVTGFLVSPLVGPLVSLLTAFYAGELLWRERDARTAEITDAAPLPDWVPLTGKLLALTLLLAAVQAVLAVAGMGMQVAGGVYRLEPWLYVRLMFGAAFVDYLLLAVVAVTVHALAHHKYVGHVLVMAFYLATRFAGALGIEHRMLVYGSDPGMPYSDMAGFGPFAGPVLWFKLYWAGWALLLAVVASLAWVRGTETGARRRLRLARRRWNRGAALGAAAAVALILSLGGFVFYNTNVRNAYRTALDKETERAEYERRYKRFEFVPQPRLTRARLEVELTPDEGRARTRGTYVLVNADSVAIDSVHVTLVPAVHARSIGFDRPARAVLRDADLGYWIYRLDRPLAPGDSLRMHFATEIAPRGFTNDRPRTEVVGNGTFLTQRQMPSIGYQRDVEVPGTAARRAHGLPARPPRPSIHDARAVRVARSASDAGWIQLETIVGTAPGQTAVAPGSLRRAWTEGGRAWFHYRTDAPVLNFYGILSARYAVRETTWNGVRIQAFYHPGHEYNVDRVMRAARASLEQFTAAFGPYPHPVLRLVEFPRYQRFARSYPAMVVFSEGTSLLARVRGDVLDTPYLVTAHELGHQWWGNQMMGADVQGSPMLSETLAQYGAILVMEREHGDEAVHRFLRTLHVEYLNRRGNHGNPEVPLMLTGDHDHIHYRKGAVVMYALRDYLGEARVNAALRRVVQEHAYRGPPFATTLDLHRELAAVTPDSLRYVLTDLLETITVWDLRADGARAEPVGDGRWRVTLDVSAAKLRSDSVGNHTEVPMDQWVDVGVFAAGRGEAPGRPLYLRRHRIRAGRQTVTVIVSGRPARAGIDPYNKLLARYKERMDEQVTEVDVRR
ncbi:ABC transporter permease/M1 family aminopeptidase [Longimicrobium sp.]|uniref:ABC transporter permease/M1 family aminopeptidase n=1 Tax=Longimicrobium sp. TaxID=2029185 RepID=UPI002E2ECF86|nr:M1 family aminopeptidase [Longimicrobium sp.]HEX6041559.1 M1 family aminopeptidase [Longimicrobium sp.]